jgi:hypothetical protein
MTMTMMMTMTTSTTMREWKRTTTSASRRNGRNHRWMWTEWTSVRWTMMACAHDGEGHRTAWVWVDKRLADRQVVLQTVAGFAVQLNAVEVVAMPGVFGELEELAVFVRLAVRTVAVACADFGGLVGLVVECVGAQDRVHREMEPVRELVSDVAFVLERVWWSGLAEPRRARRGAEWQTHG